MENKLSEKKTRTKSKILNSAREVFLVNGYNKTEMNEIAFKAGIDKRTIYRYFANKEALAFAIWKGVLAEILDLRPANNGESGHQKLSNLLYEYIGGIQENKEVIKFLGEFDHVFSGEYPKIEEAEEFVTYIKSNDNIILVYIKEGIKDGSLSEDLDAELVSTTISNMLMSLSQRVVIRGEHLKIEQGYSHEMLAEGVRLLLLAIRGEVAS